MKFFRFDGEELWVNKEESFLKRRAGRLLRLLLWSIGLSIFYYLIIALLFTTDQQRQMRQESKAIEAMYEELAANSQHLQ